MGVMVRDSVRFAHAATLTVEPGFKSSGRVPDALLTIGEVARRAHVRPRRSATTNAEACSSPTLADSGQRRYRLETLRRLVFIGMLQDAGLALDDIAGILDAPP